MNALDERIERSRRLIQRFAAMGDLASVDEEAARLDGLVTARYLAGGGDEVCLHPMHTTAGLDADGKTMWRCTGCGEQR